MVDLGLKESAGCAHAGPVRNPVSNGAGRMEVHKKASATMSDTSLVRKALGVCLVSFIALLKVGSFKAKIGTLSRLALSPWVSHNGESLGTL